MRQSSFLTAALALVTSVFGVFLPTPEKKETDIRGSDLHVFKVVVVGGTVTTDGNQKVGSDVWQGAQVFAKDKNLGFDLVAENDENNASIALTTARRLEKDPRVLAVVGHSISVTTRAAVNSYAEAGIPFVLPVATAQSAVYPLTVQDDQLDDSDQRLDNAFRLRPSDDKAQAPAISYLVTRIAEWKIRQKVISKSSDVRVHVVLSTDSEAGEYSKPLGRAIKHLLTGVGFAPDKISLMDGRSSDEVVQEIVNDHDKNDIVVFCGYPTQASSFLKSLLAAYKTAAKSLPSLIFSEASQQVEQAAGEAMVYRTSPEDIGRCTLPAQIRNLNPLITPSAEFISGYDALHLISIAVMRCKPDVSRRCVLKELQDAPAFPGACRGYSFRNGESVLSSYYVFRSANAPDVTTEVTGTQLAAGIQASSEISPGQIIQLQASTGAQTDGHH